MSRDFLNRYISLFDILTHRQQIIRYQHILSFFGKNEVIKKLPIIHIGCAFNKRDRTVNGNAVFFRINEFNCRPFRLEVFRYIVKAHTYLICPSSNLVMGCCRAGLQFSTIFLQFSEILRTIILACHKCTDSILRRSCCPRIRHNNLSFPFGIKEIIPVLRRFFLCYFCRVISDTHIHHTGTGIITLRINKYLFNILCFRRFIFFKNSQFLKSDVVSRITYPDNISCYLPGFGFCGNFSNNFSCTCEIVVHLNIRIFLIKGLFNGVQLIFLHGRVQHNGFRSSGFRLFILWRSRYGRSAAASSQTNSQCA